MELERHIAQCNGFPTPTFTINNRKQDPYWNANQGNQIDQVNYQYVSTTPTNIQYNKNIYPTEIYGDIYSSNIYTSNTTYNSHSSANYQNSNIYDYNYSGSSNGYSNIIYTNEGQNTYSKGTRNSKAYFSPIRNYNSNNNIVPRSTNIKRILPTTTVEIRSPKTSRLNSIINSPKVVKINRGNANLRPITFNQKRILSPVQYRSKIVAGRHLRRPFSRMSLSVIH